MFWITWRTSSESRVFTFHLQHTRLGGLSSNASRSLIDILRRSTFERQEGDSAITGRAGSDDGRARPFEPKRASEGILPSLHVAAVLDVKGDVYPCFMSMSRLDTRLGNLVDDAWPTKQCDTVYSRYSTQMKNGQFADRHSTWFDSLIAGCAAADFLANERFGFDADGDVHEATVAGTILGLAETQA